MKYRASTADILGLSSKIRIPARWAKYHKQLCSLREQLQGIKAPVVEASRTDDVADAGAQEIDQNLEMTTHRATQETLGEILAAIRRIERGTYGQCELTGEEIEAARLEATPWARYSLAGQAEIERTVGNTHARLGERQSMAMSDSEETEGEEPEEGERKERSTAA